MLGFIGQVIATAVALGAGLALAAVTFTLDVVALFGCAICDDSPPNYAAAFVMTLVCAILLWLIFLGWKAVCGTVRYRERRSD